MTKNENAGSESDLSAGLSGGAPTKDVAIFLYDLNGVTAKPWLNALLFAL